MFHGLKGPLCAAALAASCVSATSSGAAEPGIDEANKVVTIGAFTPVTGPVPFYAILTHAAEAYYRNLNESGGIDGWTINYVTKDDGYDPARSVAVTRQMVEDDGIFALSASIGTATNVAVLP